MPNGIKKVMSIWGAYRPANAGVALNCIEANGVTLCSPSSPVLVYLLCRMDVTAENVASDAAWHFTLNIQFIGGSVMVWGWLVFIYFFFHNFTDLVARLDKI